MNTLRRNLALGRIVLGLAPVLGAAGLPVVAPRPALAAPAAEQDAKPAEPVSRSPLVGVALPEGAFRVTDPGALQEVTTQLRTVATEGGFTLGRAEAILWGGQGHSSAQSTAIKDELAQTLKGAGYNYQVAGEKDTKDGRVTIFAAGKTGAKQATLGLWVAGDSTLLLAWGTITPKDAKDATAKTEKTDPPATQKGTEKGPTPSNLLGTWSWTTISSVGYRDTTTNQLLEPSGMSARFTFSKDGRYDYFFYVRQRTYNLVSEATTTHEGTVTFNGDGIFVLHPEKGHYRGNTGSRLIDRPMTQAERKPMTFWWEWRTEGGKKQLYIGPGKGTLSRFKPGK